MCYRLDNLSNLTPTELTKAFEHLPVGVTYLDLSKNDLYKLSAADLIKMLTTFPVSVTSLDLGWNDLYCLPVDDLVNVLNALPVTVTFLDLRGNLLSDKLERALKALPASVTCLELSLNGLNQLSADELMGVLKNLPVNVTSLNLSRRGLCYSLSADDLIKVILNLPVKLKSVLIDDKTINMDEFRNNQRLLLKVKTVNSLEPQLLSIEKKAKELSDRKFERGYNAANSLHKNLVRLMNQYSQDKMDDQDFKKESLDAIVTARPVLEQHRGWKEVLSNIVYCILGLGFGYLAVCLYKGSIFKFKTDSANKLDDLQHGIENIAPLPLS